MCTYICQNSNHSKQIPLLTANPREYEAFHDGRWCTSLRAHVNWPRRMVALVLVTEPVTDDRLDPLRRQNQQDCAQSTIILLHELPTLIDLRQKTLLLNIICMIPYNPCSPFILRNFLGSTRMRWSSTSNMVGHM
jgi:hypothetical protein